MDKLEKLRKAVDNAIDVISDVIKYYPKTAEYELKKCAYNVIADWYADYPQKSYSRKGDLFHAFKINTNTNGELWEVEFGPEFMEADHHQDNDFIYENSFIEGYHGGSISERMGIDVPRWRTPISYYKHWYLEAPQSFSPYERAKEEMQKKSDELDNEIREIVGKAIKQIRDNK